MSIKCLLYLGVKKSNDFAIYEWEKKCHIRKYEKKEAILIFGVYFYPIYFNSINYKKKINFLYKHLFKPILIESANNMWVNLPAVYVCNHRYRNMLIK